MTSKTSDPERAGAARLLNADAVRHAGNRMLEFALRGDLDDWTVRPDRLEPTADRVAGVVRAQYPGLDVPVHSRWRHLVVNGHDLWGRIVLDARWESRDAQARAAFDLVITSVLLDAGAGSEWRFRDPETRLVLSRSEGLALASLRWFESGGLSTDPAERYRVDAAALRRVDGPTLERAFQAAPGNALLGANGRAALLNRLGTVIEARPDLFAISDSPRPGGLYDALRAQCLHGRLAAGSLLETLLTALGPMWENRPTLGGIPLGDCWRHPLFRGPHPEDAYVPLHKLSQWLAYSLIEPLEQAGVVVHDVQALTGLAEYRNGGLLVDMGVLAPRDAGAFAATHAVADPFIVAWRSLTVALLDRLAPMVAVRLGLTADAFPLARVLEGGTWATGRIVAREAREQGGPPFNVTSDGTVF